MLKEEVLMEIKKLNSLNGLNKHKKIFKSAGIKRLKITGSTHDLLKRFSTAMLAIDHVLMLEDLPESCISLFENNIDLMLNPVDVSKPKQKKLITINNKPWTEKEIGNNMV